MSDPVFLLVPFPLFNLRGVGNRCMNLERELYDSRSRTLLDTSPSADMPIEDAQVITVATPATA
jgi:hypothetical protein